MNGRIFVNGIDFYHNTKVAFVHCLGHEVNALVNRSCVDCVM